MTLTERNRLMTTLWRVVALAVLLPLALSGSRETRAADKGDVLENRLKAAKLEYRKVKDGVFRVLVEVKGEITAVIVEEKKAPWKDATEKDALYAFLWTEVMQFPADFKPPPAMLSRLAELNDRCRFGSIGLSKTPEGNPAVYRNMSFFLKGSDAEQLTDYVYMMHNEKAAVKKELKGFQE
jgi:hypothetical protein